MPRNERTLAAHVGATTSGDRRRHPARGQVVPVIAVALLLAGVLAVGLVHVAGAASRRAAAHAAADATALAGAADGRAAAEAVASANDARLVGYREDGTEVEVEVVRADVRATARARWEPTTPATPEQPPP